MKIEFFEPPMCCPKKATMEYKEAVLAEAREKFDACTVMAMEEELNSPCTEEMAAFQKFVGYMTESDFDVIVFDTAPTGHRRNMQLKYLAELSGRFPGAAQLEVPMYAGEIKGLSMLREMATTIFDA
ncbi:MAG: hypothetical protein KGZ63_01710 [Clostridiales bacterium]|jgi:anion-transporting  ArsA/GET3 family ATPase|nr:hypothetical protein [Clostridiales bacterium]